MTAHEDRFDVWLLGALSDADGVTRGLATTFGVDAKTAAALLARAPVMVKRGVDHFAAREFIARLEALGARVEARPVGEAPPLGAPSKPAAATPPRPATRMGVPEMDAPPTPSPGGEEDAPSAAGASFHVVSHGRPAAKNAAAPNTAAHIVSAERTAPSVHTRVGFAADAPAPAVPRANAPAPAPAEPSAAVRAAQAHLGTQAQLLPSEGRSMRLFGVTASGALLFTALVVRAMYFGSAFRGTGSVLSLVWEGLLLSMLLFTGVRLREVLRGARLETGMRRLLQGAFFIVSVGLLVIMNLVMQTSRDLANQGPRGADGEPARSASGEPATPAALGVLVARAVRDGDADAYRRLSVTSAELLALEEDLPTEGRHADMGAVGYLKREDHEALQVEFLEVVSSRVLYDVDVDSLRPVTTPNEEGGWWVTLRIPPQQRGIAVWAYPWRDGVRARALTVLE